MGRNLAFNLVQVAVILFLSPLLEGILARLEEMVQSKRGPSIFQVYRDICKLLQKDEIVSSHSSWVFRAAPYFAFTMPLFVALLIPVLTDYPLFFAFMGDMLAVGFLFALSGSLITFAAVDTTNPYGSIGASRSRMVSFLAEPVFMMVFFTVSFIAGSTIPYIVQKSWAFSSQIFWGPSHILVVVAFLMLFLADENRIPVDNPHGNFELAMIGKSKYLEYSGRGAALIKWGGAMKFMVLAIVFCNVLVTPWGLASGKSVADILLAIPLVFAKLILFLLLLVAIESNLSKLRLFRINEFLGASFVVCVMAMVASLMGI
ncbi:MAG: NADH-quinone oxidoreductase subunit H [Candidatus Acidiferrales bacterium]